jgi:YVTN family beta-propeller protein
MRALLTMVAQAVAATVVATAAAGDRMHFESPHVHPLALTPDGARLLAVNTPDARLEVFDVLPKAPFLRHAGSISVGIEPISVRARSAGEAWVVNHVSDTVSIVDLVGMRVAATLETGDEPCDVVFAGSPQRAFVSVSGLDRIEVFDPLAPFAAPQLVPLVGDMPRALATDGVRVYAAFFGAGNDTTVLHESVVSSALNPYPGTPNPPPNDGLDFTPACDPLLPPPAPASLVVRKDAAGAWRDVNGFDWSAAVGWNTHGHDVAILEPESRGGGLRTRYARGLMSAPLGMTTTPSGSVVVVGLESRNEIRFEPNLRGVFVRAEAAVLAPGATTPALRGDLNPHLTYATPQVPFLERLASIGDPRMVVASADGTRAYVAGMGSSNLVAFSLDRMARVGRADVGEGPTGVALDAARARLYTLNRFASSISVVDEAQFAEVAEVPFFDPLPRQITRGRRILYDTHLTSGLGQASCASCHIDARTDFLVWDMGSPDGAMGEFNQVCNLELGLPADCGPWHPMKGPMASQTLLGLAGNEPFHWRGDRAYIANFAHLARTLQGMERDLTETELKHLDDYLSAIAMTPNPNRNRDGSLRAAVAGGDPTRGAALFARGGAGFMACANCHASPAGGGAGVFSTAVIDDTQPLAIPDLRQAFMKAGFERSSQANHRGFGFGHDGSGGSLVEFLGTHVRAAIGTGASETDRRDLAAFVLSWNTGMHPAVGAQATVDGSAASRARRDALLAIAQSDLVALVAKFVVGGVERGVVYSEGAFASDVEMETHTIASLDALARRGTRVTYTLVTPVAAERWLDRDGDGHRDGDERARCTDPADPRSFPGAPCLADLDRDGAVNGSDLARMLNNWGGSGGVGDIDCSGAVNGADLALLLNAWGGCGG